MSDDVAVRAWHGLYKGELDLATPESNSHPVLGYDAKLA